MCPKVRRIESLKLEMLGKSLSPDVGNSFKGGTSKLPVIVILETYLWTTFSLSDLIVHATVTRSFQLLDTLLYLLLATYLCLQIIFN